MEEENIYDDSLTMEQISNVFGSIETLGCNASSEEFTQWYEGLQLEDDPSVIMEMLIQYLNICAGISVDEFIPSDPDPDVESVLNLLDQTNTNNSTSSIDSSNAIIKTIGAITIGGLLISYISKSK